MFRSLILFSTVLLSTVTHAMKIDGVANEAQWRQAEILDEFFVVEPQVLNEPELRTEARVFANNSGIYIAITSMQPEAQQRRSNSGRDAKINGDSVRVIIDFNGDGDTAYAFELANGSGFRDGILQSGLSYSEDWDGQWQGASLASEDRWVAEFFLPWEVAPMKPVPAAERRVGVYVDRFMYSTNIRAASAPVTMSQPRFVANFARLSIANQQDESRLSLLAYGVAEQDMIEGDSSLEPGFEAHWQSQNNQRRLALGVKPNFDDVVIDKLVFNFNPQEVFFPERRVFFAKNNRLFDVRGNQDLRLLHTRRIASPFGIGNGEGDVDLALKYGDTSGAFHYGVLVADESDNEIDSGRRFAAGRLRYQRGDLQGGLLSTFVEHADLDREAMSHSMDLSYQDRDGLAVNALVSFSDVEQLAQESEATALTSQGMAVSLRATQQITENWIHQFDFQRYDEDYQVNDFGFLPRADLQGFRYRTILNSLESNTHNLEFSTEVLDNISGLDLSRSISMEYGQSLSSSAVWQLLGTYRSPGHDDLITRGNRDLKTEEGFLLGATWQGKARERFYYQTELQYQDMPIEGRGYYVAVKPGFNLSEHLALHLDVVFLDREAWKIWQEGNLINTHKRKQFYTDINLIARINEKQKLQLNFQWISLAAQAEAGGEIAANGALINDERRVEDFTLADTAFQVRYSYQLAPKATALLIYHRAGRFSESELALNEQQSYRSPFGTLPNGWQQRSLDNLLLKLSWAF